MACCFKGKRHDGEEEEEGVAKNRGCTDVLFLILFAAYLAAMAAVAGVAFKEGDARRLAYGLDSRGLLCGANNSLGNGSYLDLTDRPNLYYLNALDLLNASTIAYAKSVCVADCPGDAQRCRADALPCAAAAQYRCPYYKYAEDGLYGALNGDNGGAPLDDADTEYWGALANVSAAASGACDAAFLAAANGALPGLSALAGPAACAAGAAGRGAYLQARSQFPGRGPCYPVLASTTAFMNRCFPAFPEELLNATALAGAANASRRALAGAAGALAAELAAPGRRAAAVAADISRGAVIVVAAGLGGGAALSLAWMAVLRYAAGLMAWAAVLAVNGALAGAALYCWALSGRLEGSGAFGAAVASAFDGLPGAQDPSAPARQNWLYAAYACTALAGAALLLTLVIARRVKAAVACVKAASQAVAAMPSVLLFPLLPFVLEVGLVIYWVAVAAVLWSAGVPTAHWRGGGPAAAAATLSALLLGNGSVVPAAVVTAPAVNATSTTTREALDTCAVSPDCYISYDWDGRLMRAFVLHLFGLLWANQFIAGFTGTVVAGAVASFYWARGDRSRMPRFPVARAVRRTVRCHLGSVALGALVLAVVQFVRIALAYLDRKTRRLQQEYKAASWAMCIVRWLAWLVEKIVAFVNRNAFILVAVKGTGYCASAARGVQLAVNNALRLAAVNIVGDALLFLGKLSVGAACGVGALAMGTQIPMFSDAARYPATYLSSAVGPAAVAVLTGFAVAQLFFSVYELAIDTLLLSFCEDCERHDGRPAAAPPLLMHALGGGGDSAGSSDGDKKRAHRGSLQ